MRQAFPLLRDLRTLKNARFDLLVIGGGIYGAWTAADAALRGLRVALVERNDWGSGTSSASSKLIHGGLRYLEHFEFKLVRHALAERRVLTGIAPHLVRPLRFMVPVWKSSRVGLLRMTAGLKLYDVLAGGSQPVERHRAYTAKTLLQRHPYLQGEALKGGLSYGDCQEDDARMTLAVVASAQAAGAVVLNRVAAESLIEDARGVHGAELRDVETGEHYSVQAHCTVLAGGPWAGALMGTNAPKTKLIKGVHLLMPALPGEREAFLLTAPQDGRVFFVIPWYGRSLVGTTESQVSSPAEAVVQPEDVRYLLDAVNHALPQLKWTEADVLGRYCGVRTLQAEDGESLSATTREFVIAKPRPRLLAPIGGKYTTARYDAVEIVDEVFKVLQRAAPASLTHSTPLPGAPPAEGFDGWQGRAAAQLERVGIDAEAAAQLALRHGTRIDRILALVQHNPSLARRLHADLPFIQAEVTLAGREEMARSLDDVLRRRMPLSLLTHIDAATAHLAADLLGAELHWTGFKRTRAAEEFLEAQAPASL